MKPNLVVGLLLSVLFIGVSFRLMPVAAQEPGGSRLTVLSSTAQEIVLALTVADFQVEPVEVGSQIYQRLVISGATQTEVSGKPQLPTRGALVGVPTTAEVSVEIVEASSELLDGFQLPPAAGVSAAGDTLLAGVVDTFILNDAVYSWAAFYPNTPVSIGQTALVRDQAVVPVHFYPVQYNPVSRQIKLYRRLVVRLTWTSPLNVAVEPRTASPAYEQLLQSALVNYDSLSRPPVASKPNSGVESDGVSPTSITPTLKIGVTADGIYQLTYTDLVSAGFDLSGVKPQTIKLSNRDLEIPIVVTGEADGVFDPTDTILFYGQAITDVFTTENVYWLTVGGSPGRRMSQRNGAPSGSAPVPAQFPATLHAEENHFYWQTIPNGAGQDHWFWEVRYTAPISKSYSITLSNISPVGATATVRFGLKGYTAVSAAPDHHTRIYLNGHQIDDQWWDGQINYEHWVDVPQSYLVNGSNIVQVEAVGDTGAEVDQLVTNWLELEYWDTYVAENDRLLFGPPEGGTFQFEVTGFSTNTITLFDITDPANTSLITNTVVISRGNRYTLQVEAAALPESRYLAFIPTQYHRPFRVELDQPSIWKSAVNGADYVIITHPDFYTSTLPLAEYRRATGLQVVTVKVDDLYDEFNGGIFNPQAIRDFLAYAYTNWTPAPTYVLLVGDANYDTKDNYHTGKKDFIPAPIIETDDLGETPSDNWFVTISGADILPDMLIGRLSANDAGQLAGIINKIIRYEQSPPDATWNTKVLLVADDEPVFESLSEELAGLLPAVFTKTKVYVNNYPPGDPTVDIGTGISSGNLLVNYAGHGNSLRWGSWSGGYIYETSDILALDNADMLPVVTVANCLNGFFSSPFETETLIPVAEAFQRPQNGGAVAVWAPTGLGYPSGYRALMTEFYRIMFQNRQYTLGTATTAAKVAIAGQNAVWDELVETYVFFGDPAMRLGISPDNDPGNAPTYLPIIIK